MRSPRDMPAVSCRSSTHCSCGHSAGCLRKTIAGDAGFKLNYLMGPIGVVECARVATPHERVS